MHTEISEPIGRSKRFPRVVGVLFAIISGSIVIWAVLLRPIEGTYSGRILNSLSTESVLVLKEGMAYIKPSDRAAIPYGRYFKRGSEWILTTGTNQDWILERDLFGFGMIDAKERKERHKFVRSWLNGVVDVASPEE